jgi:Mce-associated membrane protein
VSEAAPGASHAGNEPRRERATPEASHAGSESRRARGRVIGEATTGAARPGRRRDVPLLAAAAALVIAAVAAAWFGWSWHQASGAAPSAYSQARDHALQAGEQAVQNFNTLDYRHVSQGISLWLQSSTGSLRSQVLRGRAQFEQQVRQAKTITTARVLDGAVTALNTRAGTATVIVALQVTVIPASGSPVIKQNRLEAGLTRTSSGWKLSAIGQVPVQ